MDLFKNFNLKKYIPQRDVYATSILMLLSLIYGIILLSYSIKLKRDINEKNIVLTKSIIN